MREREKLYLGKSGESAQALSVKASLRIRDSVPRSFKIRNYTRESVYAHTMCTAPLCILISSFDFLFSYLFIFCPAKKGVECVSVCVYMYIRFTAETDARLTCATIFSIPYIIHFFFYPSNSSTHRQNLRVRKIFSFPFLLSLTLESIHIYFLRKSRTLSNL